MCVCVCVCVCVYVCVCVCVCVCVFVRLFVRTGNFQYKSKDIIWQFLLVFKRSDSLFNALPTNGPHRSNGFPIAPCFKRMEVLEMIQHRDYMHVCSNMPS